jgi:hypothetical protein
MATIHLDFDPLNADHRRAADWLEAQPDPAEAVVRLIRAANEGERRLQQWEELATLLANEIQQVRAPLTGRSSQAKPPMEEIQEDPESARRLDTLFKQRDQSNT